MNAILHSSDSSDSWAKTPKPTKIIVPLNEGLAWRDDGNHIYQQKMDGCFDTREAAGNLYAGEKMADGRFIVFDLLFFEGADARPWQFINRWEWLLERTADIQRAGWQIVPHARHGGQFLQTILAAGGEGIVRKRLGSTWYDPMEACKRNLILTVVITGFVPGVQSVTVRDHLTGENRGKLSLRGGKCDRVRVGSVLRVECMELHESGLMRQPQPCAEWLVSY